MQSDDPPFLLVGTEVSAKFKGAFCEAKVKKIVKSVKCKVLLKEAPFGSVTVEDTNIRGKLELNQLVEITQGKNVHKGIIQNIKDCSTYTVVFNDGDERVLRRTQVCLKGARHFDEAVNLDSMPLYHPESFASSISSRDMRKRVLKRKAAPSNISDEEGEADDDNDSEADENRSSRRSSSIVKSSLTTKASPSILSLRVSVRRSASVTPSKSGLAVRSSSRTSVLKTANNDAVSKSPTPTPRSVQPSPSPGSRASSVAVSAKRTIHRLANKTPTPSESSEDEQRGEATRSSTRNLDKVKLGTDKNGSVASLPESTLKSISAGTAFDASAGFAPMVASTTSASNSQKTASRRKERNTAESSSGTIADADSVLKLSALSASTSRLMAPTIASRGKAVKPTDRSSSQRELSKSSLTASISSNFKPKEAKQEKSQHSTKKKSSANKPSSSHETADNAEDSDDDGAATKKYPIGSVVVINEFGPPKIGGRIHLGMVVSMKEYKTNAISINKIPQPQSVGKRQIPVRSFQNGRYHAPYVDHLSAFNPMEFRKLTDASLPCVKIAFERANLYYTKKELPQSWEKRSSDTPSLKKESMDVKEAKEKKKHKSGKDNTKSKDSKDDKNKRSVNSSSDEEKSTKTNADDESGSELSSDEEEDDDYNERRDRFVAHFYKFQDESGNPMNRVPVLGGREIDLYRFYDVVNRMGGHKRVTMESRWRRVLTKLRLEDCSGATPQTVKNAYLRYFEKFEFFMKHLGYSSLNDTGSSSRSSRTIRTTHESDWKKNAEKRKEKRAKEKSESGKQRASSKDSSVDAPPLPKVGRLATPTMVGGDKPTSSSLAAVDKPTTTTLAVKTDVKTEKQAVIKSDESEKVAGPAATLMTATNLAKEKDLTKGKETTSLDAKPVKVILSSQQPEKAPVVAKLTTSTAGERKPSLTCSLPRISTTPAVDGDESKKPPKRMPSPSPTDAKAPKIKKESRDGAEKADAKSGPIMRTKSADMTGSTSAAPTLGKKLKHVKPLSLKKSSKNLGVNREMTSSDEDLMKHFQKRRGSSSKEGRVKSPLGHQAVEDQDVGYSNANIFTRFYQGQKVHARHHLRFYDARIVIVKQPSLFDIAKSLVNAFEVGRITHTSSPRDLATLNAENMGAELKDALKNIVNATKCFVHYLGWNSRYDEWLMLHKIRVDEKDEKASANALDALIPNELPPQLFVAAMDWCLSADGIPSLATTHAYASDQQRPRRLSSSSATRTSIAVGGAKPSAGSEPATSSSAAEFRPSKFAMSHHHYHYTGNSGSTLGIKSSGAGRKLFNANNPAVVASLVGTSTSSSSAHFGYQSPLSVPTAASRSPSSSSSAGNLLMVSTSAVAAAQPPKTVDSGHSSPLSPVLQQQRLWAYQQQFHHHQSASAASTYTFDEVATIRQRSTTESGKFTIPHLQQRADNHLSRTSSSSSIERVSIVPTDRQDYIAEGNAIFNAPPASSSLLTVAETGRIETADGGNLLAPPPTVFSGAAPIGIQYYQSAPLPQSSAQNQSSTMLILPPPPPMPTILSSDKAGAKLVSMFGETSSAAADSSNVLPRSSSTVNYFVGAHADAAIVGNLFNVHVTLAKSEDSAQTTAIYPCTSTLMSSHAVKCDGTCVEEHCVSVVKETAAGSHHILIQPERVPNDLVVHTSVTASTPSAETVTASALLLAAASTMGGRTSPLTTISSCGAVEDFDENSSIRHTETPVLNDEDECASLASNEGGGKSAVSKQFLHSPAPAKRRGAFARGRMSRHHSKSPGADAAVGESTTASGGGRTSTMRRRMPSSKSPESSGAEDDYEEQITHTDTSHAVRLRVQQRMDAEHLFASYSFIGQPELALEDLINDSTTCEESIKVIEDRMELLRDIYQTFRGKLTRLERHHKRAMAKKKQQAKDAKERGGGADDTTGRNHSPQPPAADGGGSEGDMSKLVGKRKAETAMRSFAWVRMFQQPSDANGRGMPSMTAIPPQQSQQQTMPNPATLGMPSTSYDFSANGRLPHAGGYSATTNAKGPFFNVTTDKSNSSLPNNFAYSNNYPAFDNNYWAGGGVPNQPQCMPPMQQFNVGYNPMINGSFLPSRHSAVVGHSAQCQQSTAQFISNHPAFYSLENNAHNVNQLMPQPQQQQQLQPPPQTSSGNASANNSINNSHSNVPTPQSNSMVGGVAAFNSPQSLKHSPSSESTAPSPSSSSRKRNYLAIGIDGVYAGHHQQQMTYNNNTNGSLPHSPQQPLQQQPNSTGIHSTIAGMKSSPAQQQSCGSDRFSTAETAMMLNGIQQQQMPMTGHAVHQQMTSASAVHQQHIQQPTNSIPQQQLSNTVQQQQQSMNSVPYSQPTSLQNCQPTTSHPHLAHHQNSQPSTSFDGSVSATFATQQQQLQHQQSQQSQMFSLLDQSGHIIQPSTSAYGMQQQAQPVPSQPQQQPQLQSQRAVGMSQAAATPNSSAAHINQTVLLRYLANPAKYDCGLTIFHAKIAQKSYGNEKRFFTPPPTVYLHGGGWQRQRHRLETDLVSKLPDESAAKFAESMRQGGQITDFVAFIGINHLAEQSRLTLDFSREDFAAAKSLHISDETKRKYFTLRLHLFYDVLNGTRCVDVGAFNSLRTKVISKPAKRKVATGKNADCHYQSIASGIKVAFYNRVRSQTGSTRYMHVEKGAYNANQRKWGAFRIYLIDLKDKDTTINRTDVNFVPLDGTIFYDDAVQIVDSVSGISLPPLRIRKVDDKGIVLNVAEREPVNQLHKCAFEIVNDPQSYVLDRPSYLCVNNDSIDSYQPTSLELSATHHKCPDGAIWVVTAAHTREYRFYEPNGRHASSISVGPVPIVNDAKLTGDGTPHTRLQLDGRNFTAQHIVCVGCTPVETYKRGKRMLDCPLPSLDRLNKSGAAAVEYKQLGYDSTRQTCRVTFPVTLVRTSDGVIYGTNVRVVYAYECAARSGSGAFDSVEEIRSALAVSWYFTDSHSFDTPACINARDKWRPSDYD